MNESNLSLARKYFQECSDDEKAFLFRELREHHVIHEFEKIIGAPAEMILEAVHRAPELTRRMLRGVIADAAFRTFELPKLQPKGWEDVTPEGNFAYDYVVNDSIGPITVQVKLQRSERGAPVVKSGQKYGFADDVFIVETQKTRTGKDGEDNLTRPYKYNEFDVLAVSMQPSTGQWGQFMYTVGDWLLPGKRDGEMATIQPVSKEPTEFWTNDFTVVADWLRHNSAAKRMAVTSLRQGRSAQ